jgi:putative transposase
MTQKTLKTTLQKRLLEFSVEEDPLLSMLQWFMQELMQIEAENKTGAVKGKHSPERKTWFSGHRIRRFDTRLGTTYLLIPKVRKGGYIPFFITEKKRSEVALMQVVKDAYVHGVSTRKIEKVAKALGIDSISKSQVSELSKGLDEQISEFRGRKLDSEYPVLYADALYEKIRVDGRVENTAIMVISAVNKAGKREILGFDAMPEESEASYTELFRSLKNRGLKKTSLFVSDAHQGLKNAIVKNFSGSSWQRCKVHFMRNVLVHVSHREKNAFADKLKTIFKMPSRTEALRYADHMIEIYAKRFPKAIGVLENGLEDALTYFDFPLLPERRISSTNGHERLNREIRRRSRVVNIFPSTESYIRLIGSILLEQHEDWQTSYNYFSVDKIDQQCEIQIRNENS